MTECISDREKRIRKELRDELRVYGRKCLKIRTKTGLVKPFEFNPAQAYLHHKLEEQCKRIGKVRAIVLKGRQQGCSTYVAGRYFHKATHHRGQRVFILSHDAEATLNLFGIVERYNENLPPLVRPHIGASSAKTLVFDRLDSDYKVATAGSKGIGRSQTIQLFHGSEVAFWPFADTHAAGALQAVPNEPGTEVILESTANGMGNFFHQQWQDAESDASEFEAIFIPWFWQDEYRASVPEGFVKTDEEEEYANAHGLDDEQIMWRRRKIVELKDETLFMQEYPATANEAFQMSGHDSYIQPRDVMLARGRDLEPTGAKVMGVDPARFGKDRFAIATRRGRKVTKVKSTAQKMDNVEGAGWVAQFIRAEKPDRVFVDVGGQGAGVGDLLKDWFGEDVIRLIDFGGRPLTPPPDDEEGKGGGAKNRRAEMWMLSNEWLQDPGGADIPDSDSLQADACGPSYSYDSHQRLVLEGKEHMIKRGVKSPDEWDAVALTFAEPVAPKNNFNGIGSAGGGDSTVGY